MPDPEAPATSLPPLRDVIARHGITPRKGLGQHFLLDLNLTGRIARAAAEYLSGNAGDLHEGTVIEVGPGPGGLTRALLAVGAARLIVVEKDERCVAALVELAAAYPGRLEIVAGDAREIDAAALGHAPRRIIANLPYNVATVLLLRWLTALAQAPDTYVGFALMFQAEVAARLNAQPRGKDYGRLSVIAQWLCEVQPLYTVPARAFTPPPKVNSTLVGLRARPRPLAPATLRALERVTAAAFGQRRKMLRRSLAGLGVEPAPLLAAAGLPATARAEELQVAEFCTLARALEARR